MVTVQLSNPDGAVPIKYSPGKAIVRTSRDSLSAGIGNRLKNTLRWETALRCLLSILVIEVACCQVFAGNPTPDSLKRFEYQRIRMGVPWQLIFYAKSKAIANEAAETTFARVKKLDQIMSNFDPDSELNQLGKQSRPGKPIQVSEDLFRVLQFSICLYNRSNGDFDITVGGITDLWRRAWRKQKMPAAQDIRAKLQKVGSNKICLNRANRTVELLEPGMQLDLGAIAKGYAADEALNVLKKQGITRVLVDASGDIVTGDPPPGKKFWIVGIAPLKNPKAEPTEFLNIANASVATSGDANRFVEIDGVRYSHIVNPHTGIGLTTSSSVTVIAKQGITADALASALSLVNSCTRKKLLRLYQAQTFIATGDNSGIKIWESNGFDFYRRKSP